MSRFICTPAGAVAAGRRRLRLILLGPAILMLGLALVTWARGSVFSGLLSVAAALLLIIAWRTVNQLEPHYLELQDSKLEIRLRWRLFHVDLTGASARLLTGDEKAHLEQLVSVGGMVSTSGGYDSHRLGEFDLYASNLDNALLLEAEDSRFLLTPDEPHAFVEAVGRISRS